LAERVLVLPTREFHAAGYFHGFSGQPPSYLQRLLNPQHLEYRPRAEMEGDPGFKQLIPYVIFQYRSPEGGTQLFQYTRGQGQGEARLRSKLSIGVGGHISACDHRDDVHETYQEGMRRELQEEVDIQTACAEQVVGLINDDETDVGQVHLGVVHLFDVATPHVVPREPDILESGFRDVVWLFDQRELMESWSRICLEALFSPSGQRLHSQVVP
jgi:predicted NUDIX family phosphoesterase